MITYRIFLLLRDRQGNILNAEYLSSFVNMLNVGISGRGRTACSTSR